MKKDIYQVILGTAAFAVLMDIVYLCIGKLNMAVFYGTLLGFACASANFLLLALTVSRSVEKGKAAGGYMGVSYLLRLFFIGAVVVFAIKSPYIDYLPTVISLVFPRIIITLIQGILNKSKKSELKGEDGLGRP